MTLVEQLGTFAARARFDDVSPAAREQLKIRILDSIGCALGALDGGPVHGVRSYVTEFGSEGPCTLIGGGRATPHQATLLNGALVRYLDFNDSYLAPDETCHPSDNLGAVLAAAEVANASGATLLIALAVAYQVHCRLSDEAPVRDRGFDHTTQLAYAAAAGASRAMGLDAERTANAVAISGTALNALRVTRTGVLSNWKGLAAPFAASCAMQAVGLAAHGITGPSEVFEGNKGFMQTIAGPFAIDWGSVGLERVNQTIIKRFNAEIHSQTSILAALELQRLHGFTAGEVARVDIDIFGVAHRIIGGGEEGGRLLVLTKEDADHSLPYMVAVALLDGTVMPEQYAPDRIARADVQTLLRRVTAHPVDDLSRRFPAEMPARVTIMLRDGRALTRELGDYPGFHTRPMDWDDAAAKFTTLGAAHATAAQLAEIAQSVHELDQMRTVTALTRLLGAVETHHPRAALAVA